MCMSDCTCMYVYGVNVIMQNACILHIIIVIVLVFQCSCDYNYTAILMYHILFKVILFIVNL